MAERMGIIPQKIIDLGAKGGLSGTSLQAACEMWYEQYGDRWVEQAIPVLTERVRQVDGRPLPNLNVE